jgi:anti-sigma regulatory factor (Ser/Thr protein kinase)
MEMTAYPIVEMSQVGSVRRLATRVATELGFNPTETGNVALVVSEMAHNLIKHATGGQLLIRPLPDAGNIELHALDTGPGMANIRACLRDGYSTAGSLGTGLGAIVRLAAYWDIFSTPGMGTALLVRVHGGEARGSRGRFALGAICLPKVGEQVSGDGWAMRQYDDRCLVMVADGLGHGLLAAEAAQAATTIMHENMRMPPAQLLAAMHTALRHTRGAAVAIAEIHLTRREVQYIGVGNITGVILAPEHSQHLVSRHGIVGNQMLRMQPLTYAWPTGGRLILHSDGLSSRWNLGLYPGLVARHPSLTAGVLYRDFARVRDDMTVLTVGEALCEP